MRLIHSAAGLCMMLLACSVHTETMAASQKVNVGAADAQERAGVGQRGGARFRVTEGDVMVGTQDVEFGQVIDAQGLQDMHAEGGEELTKGGCADQLDGQAAGAEGLVVQVGDAAISDCGDGYADKYPDGQGSGVSGNTRRGAEGWSTGGATPSGVTGVQEEYEGGAHTRRGAEGWSGAQADTPSVVTGVQEEYEGGAHTRRGAEGEAAQVGNSKAFGISYGGSDGDDYRPR